MVKIYTDGGCRGNPGPGAWAVVIYNGENPTFLGDYHPKTTNNQMELIALLEAIKWCSINDIPATIYSDSSYCVQGINTWMHAWNRGNWKKPKKNKELWKKVHQAYRNFNGNVYWVRGHNGNIGNEKADEVVKSLLDN